MTEAALTDKTLRSVFVGNIPYEVSEEKLKEIFSEVGPVVSFKLVFDRDSGKPKGYGFCEYKDQETALSAMRNLNNYEIAGRNLRVDNACTEKSRLEMQSLMQSAQNESQYGDIVSSEKAPEAISKAVASLPPEQMYELMKQMKQCIQNNPAEARQMLLQNPQLAYALLQAQIVMRIVDPQTALSILHPYNAPPPTLIPPASNDVPESDLKQQPNVTRNSAPVVTSSVEAPQWNNVSSSYSVSSPQVINSTVSTIQAPPPPPPLIAQDMDMRADIRPPNRFADQDLRIPPSPMMGAPMFDPYGRPSENPMDSRTQFPIPRPPIPAPNMAMSMQPTPGIPMPVTTQNMNTSIPRMPPPPNLPLPRPALQPTTTVSVSTAVPTAPPAPKPPSATSGADSEKAALIMQVLQLTDEQIAMLPAEQRQSILLLKEQIAKSTKQR